jgi:hypothetical protein
MVSRHVNSRLGPTLHREDGEARDAPGFELDQHIPIAVGREVLTLHGTEERQPAQARARGEIAWPSRSRHAPVQSHGPASVYDPQGFPDAGGHAAQAPSPQ